MLEKIKITEETMSKFIDAAAQKRAVHDRDFVTVRAQSKTFDLPKKDYSKYGFLDQLKKLSTDPTDNSTYYTDLQPEVFQALKDYVLYDRSL